MSIDWLNSHSTLSCLEITICAILSPDKISKSSFDKLIKINIGYPGTIFSEEKQKSLINIAPDLPGNIKDYDYFYQLVIEDDGMLRERAAKTWSACKKEGLNPQFKKWQ